MSALSQELGAAAGQWSVTESQTTLLATGAWALIARPNALRWGIIIGVPAGGSSTVSVSTQPANSATGKQGFSMGNNFTPLQLAYAEWGGLVQQAWYAQVTAGGPTPITVVETLAVPGSV